MWTDLVVRGLSSNIVALLDNFENVFQFHGQITVRLVGRGHLGLSVVVLVVVVEGALIGLGLTVAQSGAGDKGPVDPVDQ